MSNNSAVRRVKGDTGDTGGVLVTVNTTGNYTVLSTDNVIVITSGSTVSLEGAPAEGRQLFVKNVGDPTVNITGNGIIIENDLSADISSGTSLHLLYSNPQWYLI